MITARLGTDDNSRPVWLTVFVGLAERCTHVVPVDTGQLTTTAAIFRELLTATARTAS